MKFNWNPLGIFGKKRNRMSQIMAVCLLMATFAVNSRISVQAAPIIDTTTSKTMISSGANGVGELWMLGSATGAQNLSIVIKSPNGKLIVIDGGWEADADKLSSLIPQQGGKVDAQCH